MGDFLRGIIVGLGASIPLGPVAILCIQRTLGKGRMSGLCTGMGAATCDTFFAAISLLGVSFIEEFIKKAQNEVMLVGGVIVLLFGIFTYRTNPVSQLSNFSGGKRRKKNYLTDYLSTILMTISNPGAFLFMLGMIAFVGAGTDKENLSAVILIGVLTGTVLWWFFLTALINRFRNWFQMKQLLILNRISGAAIMIFGVVAAIDGIICLCQ
ncbi:MAG: LysE family transporter [Alistipes sp.]|nr:LysE family transporter [Candidatus Minthomonas equi]